MSTATAKPPTRWSDTKALVKPRITRMVMITAAIGFKLGWDVVADLAYAANNAEYQTNLARGISSPNCYVWPSFPWLSFALAIIGTGIACMGASALNQWMEHDTDAMMDRTKDRPVAAGRFSRKTALISGLLLSLIGCAVVALSSLPWAEGRPPVFAWLSCALTAFTVVSYAWMYTPLKRRSTLALLVGTIPGATPPMIGFAAAWELFGRPLADLMHQPGFWLPFLLMVVWQVPHFLAIAWLYREDYAKAKLAMLPVIDPSGERTFRQILIGCLLLLPIGLLPTATGMSGKVAFVTALVLGLAFLALGVKLVMAPTAKNARILFYASLIYLPLVLAAMMFKR